MQDVGKASAERAKLALKSALLRQPGVVEQLLGSITSKLHTITTSQSVARKLTTGGGTKLLGILYDGISLCFQQLSDFLSQVCSVEEYNALLTLDGIERMRIGGASIGMIQHILRPSGRSGLNTASSIHDLFWSLSLSDIYVPEDSYRAQISTLKERISAQETAVEKAEKSDSKDGIRSAKRELNRLKETLKHAEDEMERAVSNHAAVAEKIAAMHSSLIASPAIVVNYLISKRVFLSIKDAIYCAKFVKLLFEKKVCDFDIIGFFDLWTRVLPQSLSCSSEG
jgi:hypothetical protein